MSSELICRITHQLVRRHKTQGNRNGFFLADTKLAAPLHQLHIRLDIFSKQRLNQHQLLCARIDLLQKGQIAFAHTQYLSHIFTCAVEYLIAIIISAIFSVDHISGQTVEPQLHKILQHGI